MLYATSPKGRKDYDKFQDDFFNDFMYLKTYTSEKSALENQSQKDKYILVANDDLTFNSIIPIKPLNESQIIDKFLYVESPQIPLVKIDYGTIKKNIINPLTKRPYKGIILEGVFADFNDVNNNLRYYDIPQYLLLLGEFRKKVHSKKGVYGELEHPQSYAVNFNNVSHKILDVWYDESTKQVKGYVLILNKGRGLIARDIIESGGCLAISARAAGEEIDQPNGTKLGRVKLLTTYDLVYHPGFDAAVLEFKELNESEKMLQNISSSKKGYFYTIPSKELKKLNESYNKYLNDSSVKSCNLPSSCFLEWYQLTRKNMNLFESQQEIDEEKMQDDRVPKQNKLENELQVATEKDLSENAKLFFRRMKMNTYNTLKNNFI